MSSGETTHAGSTAPGSAPERPRVARFGNTLHSHTRQLVVTALRTAVALSPMTQNEIARRLYTSPKHLSQTLNGKSAMSLEMMDAMFEVLGLEVLVTVRPKTGASDGSVPTVHRRGRDKGPAQGSRAA
jgi:hypothetical protein